jgi:hypothetical protein
VFAEHAEKVAFGVTSAATSSSSVVNDLLL